MFLSVDERRFSGSIMRLSFFVCLVFLLKPIDCDVVFGDSNTLMFCRNLLFNKLGQTTRLDLNCRAAREYVTCINNLTGLRHPIKVHYWNMLGGWLEERNINCRNDKREISPGRENIKSRFVPAVKASVGIPLL
ncbi:hypothetical protein RRG08_050985 [Elysia crispata]|uniref:Uncharacterized protein n=1 Tax=Elysia crispata TaxID=231223 RepID=A0AAE0Y3L9_9GAST|nr:hypothetical protein RRG08_050985 [Elysia crispata]